MNLLIREILKRIGRELGYSVFDDRLNVDEIYIERMSREFGLDYNEAIEEYFSDREMFRKYYDDPESLDPAIRKKFDNRRIERTDPAKDPETPVPRPDSLPFMGAANVIPAPSQSAAKPLALATEHIVPTNGMIGAGAQGAAVAEIQRFLGSRGMTGTDGIGLSANGIFDEATREAVGAYQAQHPTLLQDGIVGLRTLAAMLRDEATAKGAGGAKATIAAGGSNVAKPPAEASQDRTLQLAYELGERLGRSHWPGGSAADVDFGFGFKPSPETGAIDPDALEVSTALRVPHSVDRGVPWASRKRDADIIYTALRGLDEARPR